jgi:hypothetical protein
MSSGRQCRPRPRFATPCPVASSGPGTSGRHLGTCNNPDSEHPSRRRRPPEFLIVHNLPFCSPSQQRGALAQPPPILRSDTSTWLREKGLLYWLTARSARVQSIASTHYRDVLRRVSNGVAEALTGGSLFRGLRSCHLDEPSRCVSGGRNVHDIPGQAVPLQPHQSENSRLRSSNAAVACRMATSA